MASDDLAYLASLSLHPNRPGDTSNFNPGFAGSLAGALREANAAGLKVGVMSGYRSPQELTSQGVKSSAARFDAAGNSLHSYGLAADISGLGKANSPQAQQWAAIAARHGLYNPYGIGNPAEFNHWQALPYTLDQRPDIKAALQQGAGANALLAARQGPQPLGTTINSAADPNAFMNALAKIESGNQNIFSRVDKDYPGQPGSRSQGYFQIDTPTWQTFGAKAGVDLMKYPTAMNAPRDVQAEVASLIPLSRFGARTQNMLAQQFGPLNAGQTIGALAGGFVPSTATAGQNINTAGQPSAAAPPVNGAPGAPSGTQPAAGSILPGFGTQQASDAFKKGLTDLNQSMGYPAGGAPGAGAGGGGAGGMGGPASALPASTLMPLRSHIGQGAMMAGQGAPYASAAQTMQGMAPPLGQAPALSWTAGAPGRAPFANVGAQAPGLQQGEQQLAMMQAQLNPFSPYAMGTSLGSLPDGGFGGYF